MSNNYHPHIKMEKYNGSQWNRHDLTNSISEVKMKYVIKITPNLLNLESPFHSSEKSSFAGLWLDERFSFTCEKRCSRPLIGWS